MNSTYFRKMKVAVYCFLTYFIFATSFHLNAQNISFGSSGLQNEGILNPTSLDFGPDNRLYVAQQNGTIWAFTIVRDNAPFGSGTYTVSNAESINKIRLEIPNHTDSGISNSNQQRLITGIMTAGTETNPIIYVTSSDYLLGGGAGGNDTNLDTNSSMLTKLEWNGSSWIKTDLIRGLPRCEENHAINGMDTFENGGNTYMLIAQGGQTNKGAPSNNFAGTPEYYLSGAILIVNLTQLESMPIYTDPRSNTQYVYDLPTLNDPTRTDIDNTSPDFPYPVGHPLYDKTIDISDPFGGNNSLNQAVIEPGGPIEIFSPGYRNPYDVVIGENGRIYTSDNGPNALWGGVPKIYDINTDAYLGDESTITYDPTQHYITNEMNEQGSSLIGDPLHFVGHITDAVGTYYGGHPNPIHAFPSKARVIAYEDVGSTWNVIGDYDFYDLLEGVSGYFNETLTYEDFPDYPELGEYLVDEPVGSSKVNILDVVPFSTNGITEYTASNFEGAMQGNILTASFNGDINRYVLNATGDSVLEHEVTFSGFGSIPLDVIALGDDAIFPGTVWAATYGSDNITIFEPTDIECPDPSDPEFDPSADYDNDGYTNQDEIDNGTNICSQSSQPNDNDDDGVSDLNDNDDDNDGILDVNDAFALDPDNGLTTNLPIEYPFWNNDPGTGMFGLGFTGLMLDPSGATDYLDQYQEDNLSFGGAAGKATIDNVPAGDALGALNSQQYGFQFGINVDSNSEEFTIHSKVESPYFGSGGMQNEPVDYQSYGISFGTGDQDNYMKMVLMNGISNADAVSGLQILLEDGGTVTHDTKYDIVDILTHSSVDMYFTIDPAANTVQPYYSIDNGQTLVLLGTPITLPSSFLDPLDNKGLAVSLISTSRADSGLNPFTATWDFIDVYENLSGVIVVEPDPLDFGMTPLINTQRRKYINLKNEGGPTDEIITVSDISFTGTDAGLFSADVVLPMTINPGTTKQVAVDFLSDETLGQKTATMNLTHSGTNSITTVGVMGELTDIFTPIIRINCGGPEVIASDGGPVWEDNDDSAAGPSYVVNTGSPYTNVMDPTQRDASIPDYITQDEYYDVMHFQQTSSDPNGDIMTYSIALPQGEYIVNLYFANLYNGTSSPGQRMFHVNIEGNRVLENFDPTAEYGHRIAGMVQNNVTISDGTLDIAFLHGAIQNPLVNGIEILGIQYPEIVVDTISDISSCEMEVVGFGVNASGGNPNDNFSYSIIGQPDGVDIDPSNGMLYGTISSSAINGGPNSDGIFEVSILVSKPGSFDETIEFEWTVNADNEAPIMTCPEDILEEIGATETETNITIEDPSATDNCSTIDQVSFEGTRDDGLELNDPYPVGETLITWIATDAAGNSSTSCQQSITVETETLSVQNELYELLQIFPNPTGGNINIMINPSINISEVTFHTVDGKLVLKNNKIEVVNNKISLSTSTLKNAMYFMTVSTKSGENATYKIVVKR